MAAPDRASPAPSPDAGADAPPSYRAIVERISALVNDIGGKFMLHPETLQLGAERGHQGGYGFYVTGRGGVLGDVDADVVSSAFGFFEPALVRKMWQRGTEVAPARTVGDQFTEACQAWGRRRLDDFAGAARVAELAGAVAAIADSAGLALFAGWRAQPLPDDAPARAYQLLHVLREWRGSAHVVAVRASGLTPLEAVSGNGGADRAELFGWSAPYPDAAATADRRAAAEALTTEIVLPAYRAALSEADVAELAELLTALRPLTR